MKATRIKWITDIIPNWDSYGRNSKVVQGLLWEGIPPSCREKVWPLLIRNHLEITEEMFESLKTKSKREESQLSDDCKESTAKLIPLDLPRTFPCLSFFQKDGPCHGKLHDILQTYVYYRPDVGYVQGMSYMAAMLLLFMDSFPAFTCLCNILDSNLFTAFFQMDMKTIQRYLAALDSVVAEFTPAVARHLKSLEISSDLFIMDWFLTLFSKSLPLDVAGRLWDVFLCDGEPFLFRCVAGLLDLLADTLARAPFDECLHLLTHLPKDISEVKLIEKIKSVKLSRKQFNALVLKNGLPPV